MAPANDSPILFDKDLLIAWGGKCKKYEKGSILFNEGDQARCFFQIVEGSVKMFNINDSAGKEFTQGIFYAGQSFGEPPLLIDEVYPASAITISDTLICSIPKEQFIQILKEYPDLHFQFTLLLAGRIFNKASTIKEVMSNSPHTRIIGFLNTFKKRHQTTENNQRLLIPFTRQEIANFTGLRVETVIRTLQKMKTIQLVEIKDRKLYY